MKWESTICLTCNFFTSPLLYVLLHLVLLHCFFYFIVSSRNDGRLALCRWLGCMRYSSTVYVFGCFIFSVCCVVCRSVWLAVCLRACLSRIPVLLSACFACVCVLVGLSVYWHSTPIRLSIQTCRYCGVETRRWFFGAVIFIWYLVCFRCATAGKSTSSRVSLTSEAARVRF